MLARRIGIDLGSSSLTVYVQGEGVVAREPSPLGSTILDSAATGTLLQRHINRAQGWQRFFRPEVMICVPPEMSGPLRCAVSEAAIRAGARTAWLVDQPVAAAIGAELPIDSAEGAAVCDIGRTGTQVAIMSRSGTVASHFLPVGGRAVDAAILDAVARGHGLQIDLETAERAKILAGAALSTEEPLSVDVRGRDLSGGEERTVTVGSAELAAAAAGPMGRIAAALLALIGQAPPAVAAGVRAGGFTLTGGGAQLRGLDRLLARETGLDVRVAREPQTCVARGASLALDRLEVLRRNRHVLVR